MKDLEIWLWKSWIAQLDMLSMDKTSTVNFTIINDVENMFVALVSALCSKLSEDKFQMLRRGYTINKIIRKLPSSFIDKIHNTETLYGLFDVIVESPYCNWMNVCLLEQMAAASLQPNIHHLIGQYKSAVYSKSGMYFDKYLKLKFQKITILK